MSKRLYTPLHICQNMHYLDEMPKPTSTTPMNDNIIQISFDDHLDKVHLNDFINWSIGSQFMRATYHGDYQSLNQKLLNTYHQLKAENSDISYQKCRTEFRDIVNIRSILTCWEKYKQAYIFDKDFVDELMQSTSVDIPIEVLQRLPYRCYYLDLQNIPKWEPFIGAFVYVNTTHMAQNMPNIAILRITEPTKEEHEEMIFSAYFDTENMIKNGMLTYKDKTNPHVPNNLMIRFDETQTIDNKRTALNIKNHQVTMSSFEEKDIHGFIQFIFQSMLYLASNEPDIQPSPKQKYLYTGKPQQKSQDNNLALHEVGVRYGKTIRLHKSQNQTSNQNIQVINLTNNTKRSITSHVRKAHWHTYWTGKGRKIPIVKWIPPTFVSGNGKPLNVTIHKVIP